MKRKMTALFLVALMVTSLVPPSALQAQVVNLSSVGRTGDAETGELPENDPVSKAERYVDTIFAAAPEADKDSYKRELDATLADLESLLETFTEEQTGTVNTYVGQTVTREGVAIYATAAEFVSAYQGAKKDYDMDEAAGIMASIDSLMAAPLTREKYEEVKQAYDSAVDDVTAYFDIEKANSFNQIHELMDGADKAIASIDLVKELKLNAKETDYIVFAKSMEEAQVKVDAYYSKFSTLKQNVKYATCLPRDIRDTLITNYEKFAKASLYLTVEEAYHDIGDFDVLTEEIRSKVQILSDAVDAAGNSVYQISVYDFYNGEAIKQLLDQTEKIVDLVSALDELPETITDTRDLAELLRIYSDYSEMSEEEKSMIPLSYTTKLMDAVKTSTDCDEVMNQIDAVGTLEGETDFETFCQRYEEGYRAYQSFIYQYRDISGIDRLIENRDKLDEETLVLELVKNIRQIEAEEDAVRCSELIQLEAVKTAYEKLDNSLKPQIYNIEVFHTIYQDTQDAYAVRSRIEAIRNNFTLADDTYIAETRAAYDALSSKAKAYVGDSKYTALLLAEQQLEELNNNVAALVIDKISQIGTVTVNSKTKIETARIAYNGLNDRQKALVTNYNILTLAEETYDKLDNSVTNAVISGLGTYTYNGTAIEPELIVMLNGIVLQPGIDYTTTYVSNTKAGSAKVTVRGIGNYTGVIVKNFTIRTKSLTAAEIGGYKTSYTYSGKKITPSVTVTLGVKALIKNTDYTVTFQNNKKAGKAVMVIRGMGNYSGTISESFTIVKKSIKKASVSGVARVYACTGKKIKPTVKVKVSGVTLKKKRDYTVSYSKNVARGKATITIKGKGNYTGTKKVKFKIA